MGKLAHINTAPNQGQLGLTPGSIKRRLLSHRCIQTNIGWLGGKHRSALPILNVGLDLGA